LQPVCLVLLGIILLLEPHNAVYVQQGPILPQEQAVVLLVLLESIQVLMARRHASLV